MGTSLLGDVLDDWSSFELDDEIYVPAAVELSLDTPVRVLPFDPNRPRMVNHEKYFLGIEQVRDVVDGLRQELRRPPTGYERLKAVLHYVQHDAFIDPGAL